MKLKLWKSRIRKRQGRPNRGKSQVQHVLGCYCVMTYDLWCTLTTTTTTTALYPQMRLCYEADPVVTFAAHDTCLSSNWSSIRLELLLSRFNCKIINRWRIMERIQRISFTLLANKKTNSIPVSLSFYSCHIMNHLLNNSFLIYLRINNRCLQATVGHVQSTWFTSCLLLLIDASFFFFVRRANWKQE